MCVGCLCDMYVWTCTCDKTCMDVRGLPTRIDPVLWLRASWASNGGHQTCWLEAFIHWAVSGCFLSSILSPLFYCKLWESSDDKMTAAFIFWSLFLREDPPDPGVAKDWIWKWTMRCGWCWMHSLSSHILQWVQGRKVEGAECRPGDRGWLSRNCFI